MQQQNMSLLKAALARDAQTRHPLRVLCCTVEQPSPLSAPDEPYVAPRTLTEAQTSAIRAVVSAATQAPWQGQRVCGVRL